MQPCPYSCSCKRGAAVTWLCVHLFCIAVARLLYPRQCKHLRKMMLVRYQLRQLKNLRKLLGVNAYRRGLDLKAHLFPILFVLLIKYATSLPSLVSLASFFLTYTRLYALTYSFFKIKYMCKSIKLCNLIIDLKLCISLMQGTFYVQVHPKAVLWKFGTGPVFFRPVLYLSFK